MYYAIKRVNLIPFEGSFWEINISGSIFDIIKTGENEGLSKISTFIVKNEVLIKTDPRLEQTFKEKFVVATKIEIKELLLG